MESKRQKEMKEEEREVGIEKGGPKSKNESEV